MLMQRSGVLRSMAARRLRFAVTSRVVEQRLFLSPFSTTTTATSTATAASSDSGSVPSHVNAASSANVADDVESTSFEFQAETAQLLNIVTNSLYTDKEVFLRELVSNASDALEKVRHLEVTGAQVRGGEEMELAISLAVDEDKSTITLTDTGVGMNEEELKRNLGTIARSGSKEFMAKQKEAGGDVQSSIIGQFGVGFYAAFMVADKLEVISKSALDDATPLKWTSSGVGSYSISPASDDEAVARGTKIVMHVKEDCKEFLKEARLREIIHRYSNFVNFPIQMGEKQVNEVQAIWAKNASDVSEDEYAQFYKYCATAFDEPRFTLHFKADAPIEMKSLLFVGNQHSEKYGMGRMTPGVDVYCRKVLIDAKSEAVLPEWLRFVRGVVDSEDLPLSVSRENMQDSSLLKKINSVLTKRFIRFLAQKAKKKPEEFASFYEEYGAFLKEGVVTDAQHSAEVAKLLRFSTSDDADKLTSFDEYISRCTADQKCVYYLTGPNREACEQSAYYEVFKANGVEVLFLHEPIDDFVMNSVGNFDGRTLVAIDSGTGTIEEALVKGNDGEENEACKISGEESEKLRAWVSDALGGDKVKEVRMSSRLVSSPAIVLGHESAGVRNMMKMMSNIQGESMPPLELEMNPEHEIIRSMNALRQNEGDEQLAKDVARQVYDSALVQAGLVDDPRSMIPRWNSVFGKLLEKAAESKE